MATTTTNFGWDIPQSTDLVKDGATAIAALGQDIDTAMVDLKGGTTGQVLAKASGTDLDFSWVAQDDSNAIQNAIVDAKGDLIAATAADTPARLAVGTNGQVLTADSTAATGLAWATAASGGMTTITSGSFSGSSVSLSSFGGYKSLRLVISNWRPATANASLRATINSDTGSRYLNERDTSQGDQSFAETSLRITQGQSATTFTGLWVIDIPDYTNTTTWKIIACRGLGNSNATPTLANTVLWTDFFNQVGAITTLQLFPSSGNHTSGDYVLYGVK
jgi:hypothetical protein